MKHLNAQKGLQRMYTAQILILIGLASVIPILGLIAAIVALVGSVMQFVGVYNASKDDDGYKMALYITLGCIVLNLIASKLAVVGFLTQAAQLAASWFIIMTTVRLLSDNGFDKEAQMGRDLWNVFFKLQLGVIAATLLGDIFKGFLSVVFGIAAFVLGVIVTVKYMNFLKVSADKV